MLVPTLDRTVVWTGRELHKFWSGGCHNVIVLALALTSTVHLYFHTKPYWHIYYMCISIVQRFLDANCTRSARSVTMSRWPKAEATCSGVFPSSSLISACCGKRMTNCSIALKYSDYEKIFCSQLWDYEERAYPMKPIWEARWIGVMSLKFTNVGSAPAFIRMCMHPALRAYTAQWRAVSPSAFWWMYSVQYHGYTWYCMYFLRTVPGEIISAEMFCKKLPEDLRVWTRSYFVSDDGHNYFLC